MLLIREVLSVIAVPSLPGHSPSVAVDLWPQFHALVAFEEAPCLYLIGRYFREVHLKFLKVINL